MRLRAAFPLRVTQSEALQHHPDKNPGLQEEAVKKLLGKGEYTLPIAHFRVSQSECTF